MSEFLDETSDDSARAEALENNLCEFWILLGRSPLVELRIESDCIRYTTGIPFPLLNGVARAQFAGEGVERRVDEVLAGFRERHLPMLWWTGPSTRPSNLGAVLDSRGLVRSDLPGMAADLSGLPNDMPRPPGLTVEPMRDEKTLREFVAAGAVGYGFPDFVVEPLCRTLLDIGLDEGEPIRHMLARLDGEPVATVSVVYASGVAGVYNVATVHAARRKGIGAALVHGVLRDSRESGYRIAVLEASPLGYPIYERLGFREVCTIHTYMDGTAAHASDEGATAYV